MKKPIATILWVAVAVLGAWAYGTLALRRGEPLSSAYILVAALCSYAIGYRFYSKWIAARVLALDDRRATPCQVHDDGKDFVRTNKWIVFGHHFAAISGPGPLVGPALAAQFGYLPGTLWILIGVTLGGAVQDFVVLFCSMRRDGKSLGQMVREELNAPAGFIALLAILGIMVILLAVLGLVVVKALAESPWGVFTVGATIPIALFMGGYLRYWRVGKVLEASAFGVAGLLLAVWGGKLVYENAHWASVFGLHDITLAWMLILYGLAASVLPVWLLLAPRDYLSTFVKLGTIFALALGILVVLPRLQMPALSRFVDGSGPIVAGKIFPFCFITIACGAISGFHTLIASGTTPKMITRESYARSIGYGAMCLESLVAIMALIAACTLEPGVYLSMNIKGDPAATAAKITSLDFPVTVQHMTDLAGQLGEKTLFGRTGGAATLAVGMAGIFSRVVSGHGLDLWYHFAIMFEALFILTTLDAGTRVGRYLLQDVLGQLWQPLGRTGNIGSNILSSGLMVGFWGCFLIQGVRDPLGGINSLWPLFGIANQMLAAIALCLATTILLKMALRSPNPATANIGRFCLITLIPLVWLLAATMTAGVEKIWHPDPRIGFVAQAQALDQQQSQLENTLHATELARDPAARAPIERALRANRVLHFNNVLDAIVAGVFLVLVTLIVLLSVREWVLLMVRRKAAVLRETEPVWLPVEAGKPSSSLCVTAMATLAVALAKELSGEAALHRAAEREMASSEQCGNSTESLSNITGRKLRGKMDPKIYIETTRHRFNGTRRCC
ncbi:MAG TPA: carbon starvation CstA family protein [Verrucomicrobiae bacterium]|nr:carbon starvation CstA family protein [Verrucomicrobiae bacterium]